LGNKYFFFWNIYFLKAAELSDGRVSTAGLHLLIFFGRLLRLSPLCLCLSKALPVKNPCENISLNNTHETYILIIISLLRCQQPGCSTAFDNDKQQKNIYKRIEKTTSSKMPIGQTNGPPNQEMGYRKTWPAAECPCTIVRTYSPINYLNEK
jgi:hypothetical protein